MQANARQSRLLLPLILIISLFFLWGMANHLNDILITQFKKAFTLTDFKSSLVQMAFYFGYFVFAIPAALYMKNYGYKSGVVFGLLLYGIGALLFYPAAQAHEYGVFLLALFVIASGLAFLETSANPLIVAMGDPATAERRLNFAQSFNPLGALTGIWIGREFILSGIEHTPEELAVLSPVELTQMYEMEVQAVQMPYLALGLFVILWALLVVLVKFPAVAQRPAVDSGAGSWGDFKVLFARKYFLFGVTAQFFYVGAQVCVFSFMIRYGQQALPGTGEKQLATYVFMSLVAFMVGRFIATALMARIKASLLMMIYALVSVLLCAVAIVSPNAVGMLAFGCLSFFMSLMFPTIFALSVKELGPLAKAGSSLLIMSIIGGAVLTAFMGLVSDFTSISTAVIVPLVCFAVIAAFARTSYLREKPCEIPSERSAVQ
jgi:FHS family L-fucose permease-like MFS transporter